VACAAPDKTANRENLEGLKGDASEKIPVPALADFEVLTVPTEHALPGLL
jgi:hypothetical protein